MIEYTRGSLAEAVCRSSWLIALNYHKLGMLVEARALTLNGGFLHQCYDSPIEGILELCGPDFNNQIKDYQMPLFCEGFYSAKGPDTMKAYLEKKLPQEYQHMMTYCAMNTSSQNVMNYVGQIGDDWCNGAQKATPTSSAGGVHIQLILVDSSGEDERHFFNIKSSTTLKTLFNGYAEKRGVSLRSLRFSHNGNTLLSAIGNKTPEECNMCDKDVIQVFDTSAAQEPNSDISTQTISTINTSKPKKAKGKKKKKKQRKRCIADDTHISQ